MVWETVRKAIVRGVDNAGTIAKIMFWGAFYLKSYLTNKQLPGSGLMDPIVKNMVNQATGGRLRYCMSGGGPIAQGTQEFVSLVIAQMVNGYGLTETTAYVFRGSI